jgi:hypothetical protein
MASAPAKSASDSVKKTRGVVARGRSLLAPDPVERKAVGYDAETKQTIFGPVMREYLPGDEVELPSDEITSLRQLGYIADPTVLEHARIDGSTHQLEAALRRGY